jgi:hypothetical protein
VFSRSVLFHGEAQGLGAGALATDPALALARCTDARPWCAALGQDPEGPREQTGEPNGGGNALTWESRRSQTSRSAKKRQTFSFLTCSYLFIACFVTGVQMSCNVLKCFLGTGTINHQSTSLQHSQNGQNIRMICRAFCQEVEALDLTKNEIGFLGLTCGLSPSPASA